MGLKHEIWVKNVFKIEAWSFGQIYLVKSLNFVDDRSKATMNFRVLRAWDWDIFELTTARCKETGLEIENGVRNFDEINWSLTQGTYSDSELSILSVPSNIDNIDLIIGVICGRS